MQLQALTHFPDYYFDILWHLTAALVAGAFIGMERSYHGRPAGFRTHALVCLSSSLLMIVTLYQAEWFSVPALDRVSVDPTRMAQGIMTGIGFLGAGVIMKDGLSVRGLTTAASIWITSAIGILMGVGFYLPGTVATLLTLGVLSGFRWIELRMPTHYHAHHTLRFPRDAILPEQDVRAFIKRHGFSVANMGYRMDSSRGLFEYTMTIQTRDRGNIARLVDALERDPKINEFQIAPSGD